VSDAHCSSPHQAIADVLVHYCALIDRRSVDELVRDVFTADATEHHGPGFTPAVGSDALRRHFSTLIEPVIKSVHNITNFRIRINEANAVTKSNLTAYVWLRNSSSGDPAGSPDIMVLAEYHDRFRRVDGSWKIHHRWLEPLATYHPHR
jgi:SnoaL-like domain